ncbi:MAG: hypothetical protein SNJ33_01285 [Rikenellaceae bacterium]
MSRKVVVDNSELLDDVAAMVASGERVVLLTKGQSMLPFIVGGRDSVELTKVDSEICIGDILLAKISNPTCYVIHRVINIENEKITLMGDGNLVGTEECHTSDVAARITAIIKPYKSINPNSKSQRKYAKIWKILQPVRRYLLAIFRRIIYKKNSSLLLK